MYVTQVNLVSISASFVGMSRLFYCDGVTRWIVCCSVLSSILIHPTGIKYWSIGIYSLPSRAFSKLFMKLNRLCNCAILIHALYYIMSMTSSDFIPWMLLFFLMTIEEASTRELNKHTESRGDAGIKAAILYHMISHSLRCVIIYPFYTMLAK
mgnify:CR=1 FL=1